MAGGHAVQSPAGDAQPLGGTLPVPARPFQSEEEVPALYFAEREDLGLGRGAAPLFRLKVRWQVLRENRRICLSS